MPVSVAVPGTRTWDQGPRVHKIPANNSKAGRITVHVWKYVGGASLIKWLNKYIYLNMVIPTWVIH